MSNSLDEQQIAELKEAFSLYDRDGDNIISTGELGPVMRSLGLKISESEIQAIIIEVDSNGSGNINFSDFIKLMTRIISKSPSEKLIEAFKVFDRDGNGFITAQEFKQVLLGFENFAEEDINEMLRQAGLENASHINYKDLVMEMIDI